MRDKLWISLPNHIHNNYGLQIINKGKTKYRRFIELCYKNFMGFYAREFGTFFQGNDEHDGWAYFEFWGSVDNLKLQDEIMKKAEYIAKILDMELEVGE